MATLKPPLILVANVRSGTTFTATCFKQHSGVKIWREQRMVWTTGNETTPHDRFTADMATPRIVKSIRKQFLEFQERHGGRTIMEKTPSNCLRVPFIRQVFPEARIIHLVRDGRDNVSSCLPFWTRPRKKKRMLRRLKEAPIHTWPVYLPKFVTDQILVRSGLKKRVGSWGVTYPGMREDLREMDLIEVISKQWVTAVTTAQADLADMDPSMWIEVKYENLVADPVPHFTRFLDLVDLPMTEQMASYLRDNVRQTAVGAWRKRLTEEQIEKMLPIITPMLVELGYVNSEAEAAEVVQDGAEAANAEAEAASPTA